jgi:hypothetical protein
MTLKARVNYVKEQDPGKGQLIPCIIVEEKTLPNGVHAMLNKEESPDVHFQSWVRYSDKKEPGTFHYSNVPLKESPKPAA